MTEKKVFEGFLVFNILQILNQGSLNERENSVQLTLLTSLDQVLFKLKYYLPFLLGKAPY